MPDKNADRGLLKTHREKIYPWVKLIIDGEEPSGEASLKLSQDDSPVMQQWLGDLSILYVADVNDSFTIIQNRELNGMSIEELHELATENLSRDVEYSIHESSGGYMLVAGGDHEAGAICLPGVWTYITEKLDDNILVAIPAKDIVLFIPASETSLLQAMKELVNEVFAGENRLLTRNIFLLEKETQVWSVFDKVEESPE